MRICVTGSRHWKDISIISAVLTVYLHPRVAPSGGELHVGDARGADRQAKTVAEAIGVTATVYYANWSALGKGAGVERNIRMLETAKPELLVAFRLRDSPSGTKGTDHCIKAARLRGIPVLVIEGDCAQYGDADSVKEPTKPIAMPLWPEPKTSF